MQHGGRIPTYSLFGQEVGPLEPGFCHVERVADRLKVHGQFVEEHSHPHLAQMTLWIAGSGIYRADDAIMPIAQGLFCWIPPGAIHGFEVEHGSEAIVLSMSHDFARAQLGTATGQDGFAHLQRKMMVPFASGSYAWVKSLFERMEFEYAVAQLGHIEAIGSLARLVIAEAQRFEEGEDSTSFVVPDSDAVLLTRFLELVDEQLRNRKTVAALASELGTTPYLLNRASVNALGMRAAEVMRVRHIQEAKRLLLFTALKVKQIGALVGYPDPAHFARTFHGITGQSPQSWRKARIDVETRLLAHRSDQGGSAFREQTDIGAD